MRRIPFIIISLFFAAAVFSQETIKSLVVLPASKNLSAGESAWLPGNICDKLESNFKTYTSYEMISSKEKAIRDYQKKSEAAGFDENTAIEVGKLISASHVILLTVSKAGNTYSVTAEVVNSTTNKLIAKHMISGKSRTEDLFSTAGCAVDEITIALCEQLSVPLANIQKYILKYGNENISDSEKLTMFNQEITNYDKQIAELNKEIAKLSKNVASEDDAAIKKAQLEAEKALAEEKRKVAETEKIRLADIEKAKADERIKQAARDDKQRNKILEVSKEVNKKAAELRKLKMNNQSSLGILRVIETKKAALVEIRKNVKAEQTAIAKSYEKECSAKIDAINNTPWRTAELSKGEPTKEAKQRREAQIHDLQTEYKNRILTEQERIENATEESQYEVYNEISADWKTLGEKTFYANTVSGNLRITIGEYDGNKKSWDMKYSILSDGLELHTGSSEIKYSDLETLKPSGMDFYDAVDMYDSLFRCNEPVLTFEISYKITPIKERISTYEYEFYGLKVFDTTSVTHTESMALSGSSFVCKDTISKHSKQMSPGYDIGTELEKGYTISNGGTNIVIYTDDGFKAFKNDKNYSNGKLTSVIIGRGITSIDNSAFSDCSNLTNVIIPDSVTSIGSNAFQNCSSLTTVTIGSGTTSIGIGAFQNCSNLTTVTIPDNVTSIDNYAFSGCSRLTNVTIPDSVTSIGNFAFQSCSNLTSITIPNSVTSIGNYAFSNCSRLTNVTIPNGVTSIGSYAFEGCNRLTSITIPNSVTSIGGGAFSGCSSLTTVTIPNSVTSIGSNAFQNCGSLTNVTIGNNVTSIGDRVFQGCSSLASITIPNSVTSIGNFAFSDCSRLTSVAIPDSVTSIGNNAFRGCSSLTNVTIPNSVTSISVCAFGDCSGLTSITIPNSITFIGVCAFEDCRGLTSITIPNGVTSIDYNTFKGCSSLATVNYRGTKAQWSKISISSGNDCIKKAAKNYNYTGK